MIDSMCKDIGIDNYTINEDDSIDVDGNVYMNWMLLTKLPLKFGKVTGDFKCSNNKLTSLECSPREVGGYFECFYNQLTTLRGAPKSVGSYFGCSRNLLTSLEGAPISVGGDFFCSVNQLTSLKGCSENIGGDFYCTSNKLKDFKGMSEFFEYKFICGENPIGEIFEIFDDDIRCIRWINEFDVILDGNKIIMDRLEEVFYQLEMDIPENIKFNHYEII